MVTRNFPPLTGGMERLNQQALLALQEEFDIALCGPHGCAAHSNGALCAEFSATPAWRYLYSSLASAIKMAIKFKPDIIYAGSGLAAHAAKLAGLVAQAPVVTYLHGLDIIAPSRIYQACFLPFIRRSDAIIVNSNNTARLAMHAGIPGHRINIIYPGVILPPKANRNALSNSFRRARGLESRPLLLSAGRLTERKGLVEFIEKCMPKIVELHPSICLLIIGESPAGALGKARNIAEDIQVVIAKHGLGQHVHLLGKVTDEELSLAYYAADLFVFAVKDMPGDVEGFGMVAIEAAAHGLPTAGFAVGGIPDAVAEGISGNLAASGDYEHLAKIVLHHLATTDASRPDRCRQHAESFSWAHFGQKMRTQFTNILNL